MSRNVRNNENGKFDKISPSISTKRNNKQIWRIWRNCRCGEILPKRLRFEEASERGGYQESGKFDENGEFGKIGELTKFRRKDLDLRKVAYFLAIIKLMAKFCQICHFRGCMHSGHKCSLQAAFHVGYAEDLWRGFQQHMVYWHTVIYFGVYWRAKMCQHVPLFSLIN